MVFCAFLSLNISACVTKYVYVNAPPTPDIKGSPIYGDVNSPVKIVEFTDFECYFCGQAQPALQQALKTYPKEVSLVFKNFPLAMHRNAKTAHLAAMCAEEQGKFWNFRNMLFEHQKALKREDLISYAKELGLNTETFTTCLDQAKYLSKIEKDFAEGVRLGVAGTPTFFINGTSFSGAQPFETFQQLIEQSLATRK